MTWKGRMESDRFELDIKKYEFRIRAFVEASNVKENRGCGIQQFRDGLTLSGSITVMRIFAGVIREVVLGFRTATSTHDVFDDLVRWTQKVPSLSNAFHRGCVSWRCFLASF
jgi:hypothetical protein